MRSSMLILITGLCLVSLLSPAFAGSTSLSTYYPAPNGNYKQISATTATLTPTSQAAVEGANNCNNTTGVPSYCPTGLMYYDSTSNQVMVSTQSGAGDTWTAQLGGGGGAYAGANPTMVNTGNGGVPSGHGVWQQADVVFMCPAGKYVCGIENLNPGCSGGLCGENIICCS